MFLDGDTFWLSWRLEVGGWIRTQNLKIKTVKN